MIPTAVHHTRPPTLHRVFVEVIVIFLPVDAMVKCLDRAFTAHFLRNGATLASRRRWYRWGGWCGWGVGGGDDVGRGLLLVGQLRLSLLGLVKLVLQGTDTPNETTRPLLRLGHNGWPHSPHAAPPNIHIPVPAVMPWRNRPTNSKCPLRRG